jgi:IS30 family transposase
MTFKATAARIGKDQTTVSKEVKRHLTFLQNKVTYRDKNGAELTPQVCPELLKPPFVCNPCDKKRYSCSYQKQKYVAKSAQMEYESLLAEARRGIPLNKEAFYEMDRVVSTGIKNGQHLYHILQSSDLDVSKTSVYRYLQKGYLSVAAVDFPRVVKFKPRSQNRCGYVPKAAKAGRSYTDFLARIEEHEITFWV